MRIINYNKAKHLLCLALLFNVFNCFSQGRNYTWLLGYHSGFSSLEGRISFTQNSYNVLGEQRTIPFSATQGNISDESGNILMSSNGYFIADATGDTMFNGSGINPGPFAEDYKTYGFPLPYGNIILPMPDDTNKYVLFHLTLDYNSPLLAASEIFYSIVDISLNGGLGEVVSKNNIALTGSFGWSMAACKHANGRDWWIVALSDSGNVAYKFLLAPNTVQYVGSQNLQVPAFPIWAGQPTFSPDGEKFAFSHTQSIGSNQYLLDIRLFDFDRCTGTFSTKMYLAFGDSTGGFGVSFSPNSQYLYVSSFQQIYQFDTDTINIPASITIVAINDTFLSAPPVFYTNFHSMYLAANGKIYITSTNGVLDLHEMDYPDSAGTACTVNLHNIHLPCFNLHTVPNHPNYYLGCDTTQTSCPCLTTGINEINQHDFRFSISPNPNNGNFKIMYLLPQNKSGTLQIFDITGKEIYHQTLPPWSTLQYISLPKIADGVYQCTITRNNQRVNKKLVVVE